MEVLRSLLERYPALRDQEGRLQRAGELLCAAARSGGKVLTCGNGGSASDAEHVVGELMKDFKQKRPLSKAARERLLACDPAAEDLVHSLQEAVPAICLNSQTSLLTALLNDGDPEMIFAQQVYGYGKPGDVLLGFSTSGNSKNVLHAVRVARALGMSSILITGSSGGDPSFARSPAYASSKLRRTPLYPACQPAVDSSYSMQSKSGNRKTVP